MSLFQNSFAREDMFELFAESERGCRPREHRVGDSQIVAVSRSGDTESFVVRVLFGAGDIQRAKASNMSVSLTTCKTILLTAH